jgi:hypothetical protein
MKQDTENQNRSDDVDKQDVFIPTERDAEHTIGLLREKKRYLEERLHESEALYYTLLGMYMELRDAMIGDDDGAISQFHQVVVGKAAKNASGKRKATSTNTTNTEEN